MALAKAPAGTPAVRYSPGYLAIRGIGVILYSSTLRLRVLRWMPSEFGGAGLIAVGAFQGALDEVLLEFNHGFFEQNAALDHLADQRFQLFFHVARSAATLPE